MKLKYLLPAIKAIRVKRVATRRMEDAQIAATPYLRMVSPLNGPINERAESGFEGAMLKSYIKAIAAEYAKIEQADKTIKEFWGK